MVAIGVAWAASLAGGVENGRIGWQRHIQNVGRTRFGERLEGRWQGGDDFHFRWFSFNHIEIVVDEFALQRVLVGIGRRHRQ